MLKEQKKKKKTEQSDSTELSKLNTLFLIIIYLEKSVLFWEV